MQRDPNTGTEEPDDAGPPTGRDEVPPDEELDDEGPETDAELVEVDDDGTPLGIPELDEGDGQT